MLLSQQISTQAGLPPLNIALISCEASSTTYSTFDSNTNNVGPVVQLLLDHFAVALKPLEKYSVVNFSLYDATQEEFPKTSTANLDGFLIPGSLSCAFSDTPWIIKLRERITELHRERHKTLGICFGHQVYAHATGGKAMRNPLGPTLYQVSSKCTEKGIKLFPDVSTFELLSSHSDIVATPGRNGVTLMSSDRCEHQLVGYFDEDDQPFTFTVQSHPEYCCDGKALIESVAKALEEEVIVTSCEAET